MLFSNEHLSFYRVLTFTPSSPSVFFMLLGHSPIGPPSSSHYFFSKKKKTPAIRLESSSLLAKSGQTNVLKHVRSNYSFYYYYIIKEDLLMIVSLSSISSSLELVGFLDVEVISLCVLVFLSLQPVYISLHRVAVLCLHFTAGPILGCSPLRQHAIFYLFFAAFAIGCHHRSFSGRTPSPASHNLFRTT